MIRSTSTLDYDDSLKPALRSRGWFRWWHLLLIVVISFVISGYQSQLKDLAPAPLVTTDAVVIGLPENVSDQLSTINWTFDGMRLIILVDMPANQSLSDTVTTFISDKHESASSELSLWANSLGLSVDEWAGQYQQQLPEFVTQLMYSTSGLLKVEPVLSLPESYSNMMDAKYALHGVKQVEGEAVIYSYDLLLVWQNLLHSIQS